MKFINKLRVKYHRYVSKKLRDKAKAEWREKYRNITWYGPSLATLSKKDYIRYRNSTTRIYQLTTPAYGTDVTGLGLDVRHDPAVTRPLDEANAEYKEVIHHHLPSEENRNFVSDE